MAAFLKPNQTFNASEIPSNISATSTAVPHTLTATVSVIFTATVAYNILFILSFIRTPALRTPFAFYLLNVSLCDLCLALFSMTGFIWFTAFPMSSGSYCPYYNFFNAHFLVGIGYTVVLVSIDRLLSVFAPVYHRRMHSVRWTSISCIIMWTFVIALVSPMVIMDALHYDTMTLPCFINYDAQPSYTLVLEFLGFDTPLLFVLSSYVAIMFKMNRRSHRNRTATCLQYTSCMFNPLIYHSSLPGLRKAVKNLLHCN
ncbi:C-C chemokine receptor type 1-like [Paramacrobiotus metropolitanus]|uniref:C-C chemokine receptor type 1-like n=1 Tax=Paramacrobiotus metropolitanus TaxID=2943436 RepID=UPI00244622B7|nr:C-C chemokine receptor type 1-like [Paramacrobiotus metropolitanus]